MEYKDIFEPFDIKGFVMDDFMDVVSDYRAMDMIRLYAELDSGADPQKAITESFARVMTIVTVYLSHGKEEAQACFIPTLVLNRPNKEELEKIANEIFLNVDGDA